MNTVVSIWWIHIENQMLLAFERRYLMAGRTDGYHKRLKAKASSGTRQYNPPSDIASRRWGASGSVFIIWYNPFPKMILNIFYHWKATNYWDISDNKPWPHARTGTSLLRLASSAPQSVPQNHKFAGFRLLTDRLTHQQRTFILPSFRLGWYLS